jgi:site-specific DNA-methyltransferase (adenine-specific)
MNPPYGRSIGKWVAKCYSEAAQGNTDLIVALLPVATDTIWWHSFVAGTATEVRFLKGRVHFKNAAGPAPFASAIVIWRRGMLGWHRVSYWDWKAKL